MPTKKMNVLFISTNNPGVKFYRFYQYAQKMSELGLAHCRIFPDFEPKRMESDEWELSSEKHVEFMDEMVNWADVVVCQYIHSPIGLCFIEGIRDKKPIFMEVDDYLRQVPYYSMAHDSNAPGAGPEVWATRQAIESNGVITTTEYLKKYWGQWNKNVNIIPNCINFDDYDKQTTQTNGKVMIGWIGGSNHDGDLKLVKDVLFEILDAYKNTELYMVSVPPPDWKHERYIPISQWAIITEYPKFIKKFSYDIGMAPLRDNEFNRGKSNLRYLEYSACKIPTIASRVEPFLNDFKGRLAWDDESWYQNISELVENKELRVSLGFDAYTDTKEKFNLNSISRKYAEILGGAT